MTHVAQLKSRLPGLRIEDHPTLVRQKSRDFFWYSPVLKRQLDQVTADCVVFARSIEDVVETLAACFEAGIPVTPRGAGTGNYGQAMPLSGGAILDLSGMDRILSIGPGRVVAEPGAVIAAIDREARAHSGQEMRLHPSTAKTATVGGFVAGGSGGVGSITWGGLRDFGNIIRLKIATMEATPRLLDLQGSDLHKVSHAYGTNGVIVECEMPLGPAYDWIDVIWGFDSLAAAAAFARDLGEADGILKKELAVVAAPAAHDYFPRHRRWLVRNSHIVCAMIAPHAYDAANALAGQGGRAALLFSTAAMSEAERKGLPDIYELCWNHTTLRALKVDPSITYLQTLYRFPDHLSLVEKIHDYFGDEVAAHLEFVRFDGNVTCFGLPLVRFTTEERLAEIIRIHEDMGAVVFNPHRYTLEEGGMKRTDSVQLAFKREADPRGLLNPGKMIAWDDPSYDYASGGTYLFKGLGQAAG
jgi:FAD/FMN-containing dehydrogenase